MPRRLIVAAALVAFASGASLLAGCYEKTVAASGFGADRKTIHEPDAGRSDRVLGYPQSTYKPLPTTH
jgi:hypothetical protein